MSVLSSKALQEQLSAVLGALAKAALAEICELVEEGYSGLRLEISRSRQENHDLRKKLHLIESIVVPGGGDGQAPEDKTEATKAAVPPETAQRQRDRQREDPRGNPEEDPEGTEDPRGWSGRRRTAAPGWRSGSRQRSRLLGSVRPAAAPPPQPAVCIRRPVGAEVIQTVGRITTERPGLQPGLAPQRPGRLGAGQRPAEGGRLGLLLPGRPAGPGLLPGAAGPQQAAVL
ncbi:translation initiation factor IF-2-like [Poeciliopsis prolifica]|uniref:translation initiation factor IF-2-like n=1 Tax=Poeciliopsis prolifica TaxID=188132 RepID=UPI0024142255|nr:translation initiation factor IF-2-like [Poeciliopsis prolifica]